MAKRKFMDLVDEGYFIIESMVRQRQADAINTISTYSSLVDEHIYKMVLYPNDEAIAHWASDATKAMANIYKVRSNGGSKYKPPVYYRGMVEDSTELGMVVEKIDTIVFQYSTKTPIATMDRVYTERKQIHNALNIFYEKTSQIYSKKEDWSDMRSIMISLLKEVVLSIRKILTD